MTPQSLFERHRETLEAAVAATHSRGYWSAYPEMPIPKSYGETAAADGEKAFKNRLAKPFDLDQPGVAQHAGAERSPFGFWNLLMREPEPLPALRHPDAVAYESDV